MKVKLLDLKAQYKNIEKEIDEAIKDVLESTQFIMGPNVKELEKEIADFTGVKYGIGVANGTDSLMLTLKALGVGSGDEVITTPFTFFASAEVTSVLGAIPVFADIDKNTYCIDPKSIEEKITEKTKAIIPVHIFGQMCDMDSIMDIAKRHNIPVIEDACQAIGAEYKGKKAGSFGVAGCYSFFPTKNLGCYGDGGMIVTNDQDLAEKIKMLRVHGSKVKYHHEVIGYNSRLDEIQAAILRVKFKYLNKYNELRREKAKIYNELLKDTPVVLPVEEKNYKHIYHQYSICVEKRDDMVSYLKNKGVATSIYYPIPVHLLKVYENLAYKKGDLPVTENICERVFALPMYPELPIEQQEYVVSCIKEFYNNK
ncbi:UDP-2-acetamido-2-deoxy-3-oxo-D-glucuronate aminotransferase [Clostridium acetireducens DSM 10703]|uniref:UDP-2-acetamido-2-deoxy-3-oxo-D-glucuronate aminotransferase n=1 Tax=Clostridium acetireducens DSM 10703 TaxID=1121290 RepID=A0A1E8EY80_9CLOT|nr:DegT/DnrJ/EryC1/StrS family aminotransferase [Clostridium acetireducens]OFI05784.1 UDP-2-acetamido-2-deoxy-3-oxo-D-glucuronate aminotransferase [Clostridium acetireducens DSM 10703]